MKYLIFSFLVISIGFAGCSETIDNTGTCTDGILNQGEQQVDCGGPCPKRCESCADGIMNQGETGVDCGGPCDPCFPRFSAHIDSADWWSTSRNAVMVAPGHLRMYGSDGLKTITIDYTGPLIAGSVQSGSTFMAQLTDENGYNYPSTTGSIHFTSFDTLNRKVAGTFMFNVLLNGTPCNVSSGVFNEISWQ